MRHLGLLYHDKGYLSQTRGLYAMVHVSSVWKPPRCSPQLLILYNISLTLGKEDLESHVVRIVRKVSYYVSLGGIFVSDGFMSRQSHWIVVDTYRYLDACRPADHTTSSDYVVRPLSASWTITVVGLLYPSAGRLLV